MQIRKETPGDINQIRELNYAAFKDHPHHEPGAEPTEHLIVDRLRQDGELTLSLVAEENGEILGHVALSPVRINGEDLNWFGLGPVAVFPVMQGKGVGSKLIRAALEQLQQQGAAGFVVMGDPAYYQRFGFRHIEEIVFPGVPAEYFLTMLLTDEIPGGDVSFHPAFY
ncbi:MAG: GNAT family N-acetyltransferase [Endozoicomonas sp.]